LIKYAANAFLATKITFINEMADLAERVGAVVHAIDPVGMDQAKREMPELEYCNDAFACAAGMRLSSLPNGSSLALSPKLKTIMKQPLITDLRNIYGPDEMTEHGFVYECIGAWMPGDQDDDFFVD
jgi:UDPglucose 6-dehydrogenase